MEKPNIVIIGGGYGGIQVAQELDNSLSKTHQIILIERNSHFWHKIGGLRTMVEENFEEKLLIPYTNLLKNGGKVVQATVTSIRKNEVIVSTTTEWGTQIPFKYLIIATGSDYPKPAHIGSLTKPEAISAIQHQRQAVKDATKILIIGGGPVGVELAGEIASHYKDKEITLVQALGNLLPSQLPQKLRDSAKNQLKELNVNLIFGEKVLIPEGGLGDGTTPRTLTTTSGREIESDVQFFAIGQKPNSALVATLDESLLEKDTRLVKVTSSLHLDHPGYEHIFAVGDINNIKETKLAYRTTAQASVAAKNIEAIINGKKLQEYKPAAEVMFVTVGKNGGVGLLPMFGGIVAGPFMVKNLKGKGLFVDKYWKQITGGAPSS